MEFEHLFFHYEEIEFCLMTLQSSLYWLLILTEPSIFVLHKGKLFSPFMVISTAKCKVYYLRVQSRKLYNNKYRFKTNNRHWNFRSHIFLVFKLLSRKQKNRKDNRNLKYRLLLKKIAKFTGQLLQNYK